MSEVIRSFRNEIWKDVVFDDKISERCKYKISSYGRVLNCCGDNPYLLKKMVMQGYTYIPLRQKTGKSTARYIHRVVAQHFLEQKEGDRFVIHLNYDKTDNRVENLKWATKREKEVHQFTGPTHLNRPRRVTYSKLTETKVKLIKRKINDPNRKTRMKMIAKQFGISEMQLYRIKSGENWGSVDPY
ncbi:HNH endonuclease [Sediminicola luteus]|uniref:HNH endonuclease n=1 Tax=Sediminicola luteus TaxID=319238 RepID=A0A2A4G5F2_9FLAO|nr:HNH endonuclease [Sediminicola luteus]PCE62972.1 HNH endonuclease [Sediminicola luteus]